MIINITGQAGSGKTTIAKNLCGFIKNSINIDGDELRDIFKNKDYSKEGRLANIKRAYDIALFLEKKGYTPIISLISPYKQLRDELKANGNVLEIYLTYLGERGRENFHVEDYEVPTDKFVKIDTTNGNPERICDEIFTCINNGLYKHLLKGE